MFVIQADKSKLTVIENEILVSNAVNVYSVRFSFSKDWDNFAKVAIFYNDFEEDPQRYSVLIPDSGLVSIPTEVLKDVDGTVYVGICGEGKSNEHLPTLVISLGRVIQGSCDDATAAKDPTPSIYQQILSELASIKADIASGKLRGPVGPRGLKGEKGDKGDKGDPGKDGSVENLTVDPNTMTYENGILSVRQEVIVRGVDLETWDGMTEENKRGLVFVEIPDDMTLYHLISLINGGLNDV